MTERDNENLWACVFTPVEMIIPETHPLFVLFTNHRPRTEQQVIIICWSVWV